MHKHRHTPAEETPILLDKPASGDVVHGLGDPRTAGSQRHIGGWKYSATYDQNGMPKYLTSKRYDNVVSDAYTLR